MSDQNTGSETSVDVVSSDTSAAKPKPKKRHIGRIVGISLGTLVVFTGALYGVGWALAGDRVPNGTSVQGVDLTGLSPAEAVAKLKAELGPKETAPITLAAGGKQAQLQPEQAGLIADFEATVAKAGGRTWNPVDIWRALFNGGPVELVVREDSAALKSALAGVADTFAAEAKSASVAYNGTEVVRTEAVDASKLDVDATATVVKQAWSALQTTVEATLIKTAPPITTAQADEVVANYAKPAVSGPIEAVTEKGTLSFTPQMIAAATTFDASSGKLVAATSADKLLESIKPSLDALKLPAAKNASIGFADGKPTVVPSTDGLSLDAATITKDILPLVTKTTDRKANVAFVKAAASFTTADAEKLGVKEVTGEFTTYFPDTAYRNNNLPKAAAALNGTLIKPGETFSFNKVVGQRTAERGYMAGGAIGPGNVMITQLGGGVSQVATTTYNAFFFSGIKHVAHQPHTLYFSRYPAGRESTIDWGHIDVQFYNDSPYGVYIQGWGTPGSGSKSGQVTIRIWSTKEYDVKASDPVKSNYTSYKTVTSTAADCKPQSGMNGFDVSYKRLWYKNGSLAKSEDYFWRYGTADQIVCQKPS